MHQEAANNCSLGCAKLTGKHQTVVEARQTAVLEASVYIPNSINEKCAVVEQSSAFPLPSGLLVLTGLVNLPAKQPCKLPVVIKNETDPDIVVPSGRVLANINTVTRALHKEQTEVSNPSDQSEDPSQSKKISVDFGNDLPAGWKDCASKMLNSMPEVFLDTRKKYSTTSSSVMKPHVNPDPDQYTHMMWRL